MSDIASSPTLLLQQKAEMQRIFALQQQHQYVVARSTAAERIVKLQRLHAAMLRHREAIKTALRLDFGKSGTETDITESGVVNGEIRHTIRHLRTWMRPKRVATPITLFGSSSQIRYEPKGVCLIISPWNFPFNLTFGPLVSAIAAGNCVILKPSEFTPHSAALMAQIVAECFPPEEVSLFEGETATSTELLQLPFHHIFFTGSPAVGKIVMQAAARHLSSVTLELGGKSPVVVDETADLDQAAAKVAWLNALNAGQICIAPDYVLVQENVHDAFVQKIKEKIERFYGATPQRRQNNPDYCRIVSERHFDRLQGLLDDARQRGAQVAIGGGATRTDRFLEPTVLTQVPDGAAIWEEEIFGPLLPVRAFKTLDEAIGLINAKPKSLAMYLFSRRRQNIATLIAETRNGGVSVNDCGAHFYNANLPFGGSNNSGIGKSHGIFGFQEFSNARSILRQTRFLPTTDFFLPPYGSRVAKWMLEGVVRWF